MLKGRFRHQRQKAMLNCRMLRREERAEGQEIKTFRICDASKTSEVVGSLTRPTSNPTLALISNSRSRPYTLPFGSTIGSCSTLLLLCWTCRRFRASSLSSVEHIGQTVVVVELAFELLLAYLEWQEGVLRAERPAERAICSKGRVGRENSSWWVWRKRLATKSHRDFEYMLYTLSALDGRPWWMHFTLYGSTLVSGG